MTETLASATLALARLLTTVVDGAASAGTATTITDSDFEYLPDGASVPGDDFYNGGTVWILDGTHAGKTGLVSDWVQSTKTMTFSDMGSTVGNTVKYAVAPRDFPRFILRQAVNYALSKIGGVPQRYTNATFVTVAQQLNYDIPATVSNLKRVEMATSLTTPYNYVRLYHWDPIDDDIVFDDMFQPMVDDRLIRLTYQAPLAELDDDTDTIPKVININYVKWEAAIYAWDWYQRKTRDRDPQTKIDLAEAMANAAKMAAAYKPEIEEIPRDPHFGPYTGGGAMYRGEDIDRVTL